MNNKPAVIIPLDGSETATKALGAAQAMAKLMDAMLYIVHVAEEPLSERELLEKLKVGQIEIRDFSLHQIVGADVIDGILKFAASVDTQMIVMSSHGWTYNPERLMGDTAMGIVSRAINPVLLIRPDMTNLLDITWKPKKMLVPQNGTPTAAAVMVQVFRLAQLTGAEVDVLNIGVVGKRPLEPGTLVAPMYQDYPRYDWPAWASEFVERFYAQKPPEVKLHLFEREGDPARVTREFATENHDDVIALGWHGHLEENRAMIVKELVRTSDIPLILIWSRE